MNTQALKESMKEKIATVLKENLKMEEKEFINPWLAEKSAVMHESRCFSDTPIDAEKCLKLLTKVHYLISQGEKFTPGELTELFFGVTKLFQAPSPRLRRFVYLIIKELEPAEQEVFICMSCLIKDMNSKNDSFRANSIRVLSRILDPAMAAQIDRYLKTAIVDKNAFVSSSALVCGINLMRGCPDVVRRWVNEIQETVQSKHAMVQFHALALIYELKKTDRLALHKVVTSLAKSSLKSPLAECLLIRYATSALLSERDASIEKTLMGYLESCLRHKNEMVSYEAAKAFCSLASIEESGSNMQVFGYDISHAITILQIFLTSPKSVVRFAAIRTLNQLAQTRPQIAARCNCDMEPLLTDQNRNTATLALTTLLKTGHESNVERLIKQITTFMSDISDVFKIEVVRAVKGLCLQYPAKHKTLMSFLSSNLREDGAADFKKDLVEALILIIQQVPQAREVGLLHLCEFIEDCEYPNLCTRILGFLGGEVPSTSQPSKYIRFIYNRLILENALVRAAAVDALAKIAMKCPALQKDINVLLQFGQNDNDDEVRDRISLYSQVLSKSVEDKSGASNQAFQALMSVDMPFSVDALYESLEYHIMSDAKEQAFDVWSLPSPEEYKAMKDKVSQSVDTKKKPGAPGAAPVSQAPAAVAEQKAAVNAQLISSLSAIVPAADLGNLYHSCKPQSLTESEAEYTVQAIKHMFQEYVALEFYVSNTVQGVCLENVEVRLTGLDPTVWHEMGALAISKLEFNQNSSAFIVLKKCSPGDLGGAIVGQFGAALHFLMKEDDDDIGYEDDYPVEKLKISIGDYLNPKVLPQGQFKSFWDSLQAQGVEAVQKLSLSYKTLETAVEGIVSAVNMEPCDATGKVEAGVRGHTLLMAGTFLGGNMVIVKALVGIDPNHGCVLKLMVRAKHQFVCDVVAHALE